MNIFSARVASFLLVLILVEKASGSRRGWKPSWDDDWGGSSSSSSSSSKSSKSSGSSGKSSKSSWGGWGGWDDDDDDDWKGWKGWRGSGYRKKKKNRGWRRGYRNHWHGRDLTLGIGDTLNEVEEIEEEAANDSMGN
ncbi:hypothetical protein HJC23_003130 [Cyclotella cryptica]|uniref:Uncharacterized protein n=1 Tax=Cyclotella cryptica TaxID=29204 RepID=A0ABD3P5D5_9STRA|eukprot:CCRYP_017515-RC/>CCRYP_017515-RC protein AED:0.21 eAED:0.21 QI:532/1/1/1/0.33/0.25/4/627/136